MQTQSGSQWVLSLQCAHTSLSLDRVDGKEISSQAKTLNAQ